MDNPRFNQLLDLARAGDEASVAQLWHEFGFDFHAEVALTADRCPLTSGHPEGGI